MRRFGDLRGERSSDLVPLGVATRAWWKVSLQTFGGPAGQIAVMHREMVDERRWIGERRFLHALSYCTLLPGPEAQQLAIYIGWLLNGMLGGLVAGALFVLPGFVAIMALSVLYAGWGESLAVTALFAGIAPAVLAIVAHAVARLSSLALGSPVLVALAVGAFAALALFGIAFPIVIAAAGLVGFAIGRARPDLLRPGGGSHDGGGPDALPPVISDDALHGEHPSLGRAGKLVTVGLVLWFTPIAAFAVATGPSSVFVDQGLFFSGTALVTFGGAYAVLSFVAQRAVEVYGWLETGDMIAGLAMAETTPGPLIQVVQFVGFMGAYSQPGSLNPWVAGVLAATLVTWVTYVPCFLLVFLGAPHVEALRHNRPLSHALAGITAAVVGVIANLALYFGTHTLFSEVDRYQQGPLRIDLPTAATISPRAVAVAVLAGLLLFRWRWSVLRTLAACAVVGSAIHVLA